MRRDFDSPAGVPSVRLRVLGFQLAPEFVPRRCDGGPDVRQNANNPFPFRTHPLGGSLC